MKFLWRATVHHIARPIYLVAQNIQSASAQVTAHPEVAPEALIHLQRIDPWDDQQNMTVVHWPEPPPPPEPDEEPEP
ncbi:MAG: hypothetical protein E3J25_11950 [Anaerolineales bacterium]|nr:MAG: hypothetical protein E3J25_11950 [Anaerolineales bacterium]